VRGSAADLESADGDPELILQGGAVPEMAAGERAAGPQLLDYALEDDLAARGARARAEVDDVVRDRDHLRLVLHHEHRVALVAQAKQQVVHPLDVVRVQADRRLVEDIGHVGKRRPELPDHFGSLRLAAGERARLAIEAEVTQADLHEGVQRLRQRGA
jgi:hypothetical protein